VFLSVAVATAAWIIGVRGSGSGGGADALPDMPGKEDAVPRMLELYTPWCPSCTSMEPIVQELAARCGRHGVRIDAVDVSRDENERIAERFGVSAVPTFLFLDASGVEATRLVGARTALELQRGLESMRRLVRRSGAGGPIRKSPREGGLRMPLYEYRCEECGAAFEAISRITEKDEAECPECGAKAERLVSSFSLGGATSAGKSKSCFSGG